MHYDLTISLPGDVDDAHRMISTMVERQLVPADRATYSTENGRVRIRWFRVRVDPEDAAAQAMLTHALAQLAAVAGADASEAVPHIHLEVDESRRLTQADFDPTEDL